MEKKKDALARQSTDIKAQAEKFKAITTNEQQSAAIAFVKVIKAMTKEINDWCDPNIKKWYEGHKDAVAQKKQLQAPLLEAERIIKGGVARYRTEQQKAAAEARAAQEKAAREAAEAQREAEVQELESQGQGDLAEIMKEMPITPEVVKDAAPPAPMDGAFTRKNVKVEIIDKKKLVEHILKHWDLYNHWIEIPEKHPRALAQQQREAFSTPGVKMIIETSVQIKS